MRMNPRTSPYVHVQYDPGAKGLFLWTLHYYYTRLLFLPRIGRVQYIWRKRKLKKIDKLDMSEKSCQLQILKHVTGRWRWDKCVLSLYIRCVPIKKSVDFTIKIRVPKWNLMQLLAEVIFSFLECARGDSHRTRDFQLHMSPCPRVIQKWKYCESLHTQFYCEGGGGGKYIDRMKTFQASYRLKHTTYLSPAFR